jgi:hypothetical protein
MAVKVESVETLRRYSDGTIELRKHTGDLVAKYSNKTPIAQMKRDFGNL